MKIAYMYFYGKASAFQANMDMEHVSSSPRLSWFERSSSALPNRAFCND